VEICFLVVVLLRPGHSATAPVLELHPATLRLELAYRALRVLDSSTLAISWSSRRKLLRWQRGYRDLATA